MNERDAIDNRWANAVSRLGPDQLDERRAADDEWARDVAALPYAEPIPLATDQWANHPQWRLGWNACREWVLAHPAVNAAEPRQNAPAK